MNIIRSNKKIKTPTDKQMNKIFVDIKKFQKNNTKYLLVVEEQPINKIVLNNIFTTNNTKQ